MNDLNELQALIEINPSAMEAARFIHLISSSSSLTLQVYERIKVPPYL